MAIGAVGAADAAGQAPGWNASFVVDPFPPPYLSDWETNPTVASLTVTNGTGADAFVTIYFSITDGSGGVLLQGRSDPQLVTAGQSMMFSSASTFDGTSSYDPRIEDIVVRTGRFPEDDYTACVTVTEETGLLIADNLCAFFSTFSLDPPYLLFPSDGDTLSIPDPIFEWTPVQAPITVQPRYVVQLAEILPGQTPYEALTSRILHYEDFGQFTPALQYPIGAQPFRQGQQYAWWVQALDADGYPLSANEGRSEVWTFTYLSEDGGEPAGEEIGGGAELIPMSSSASAADVIELRTSSYETIRDQLAQSSGGNRIRLPLPDVDFLPLELWNVRVDSDDAQRALAIRATASLPHSSVDLLLVGAWDDANVGTFSLALDPAAFRLEEWIDGISGTALADLELDGSILTLASQAGTLDVASLPAMVGEFYGTPSVELAVGVSVHHEMDPRGTPLGDWLESLGIVASRVAIGGELGIDASTLFENPSAVPAPTLDLSVAVDVETWSEAPEWLSIGTTSLAVTNDPAVEIALQVDATAEIAEETLDFVLRADLATAGTSAPLVLTGRAVSPWEQPFGIEWLTVDSTRLVLTAPRDDEPASALLESWVTAGTEPIALLASIEGSGESLQGVLSATITELNVGDLLGLIQAQTGRADLGAQIPPDVASLTDVRFELRSGEPPTFTVSATASALGQSTHFLYTMVPPDLPGLELGGEAGGGGTESGGGLFAIRLADWSLGNLLPSIGGTPFGDLSFPQVSFVMPTWDWGSSTPEPTTEPSSGGTWSIPWGSLGPLARDFMMPSWPCVSCALPSGGGGGGGDLGFPDLGSLSLSGGLNFSAPISLADLSSAFSGLFDGIGGGGGGDASDAVFFQGMPGISFAGLLSGNLDLTSLLDISADVDLSGLSALADMPEWLTLGTTSFAVTNEPAVAVWLEVEANAAIAEDTLDFVLRADLSTVSSDAPLVLTGRALTPWEQPFGIEWLTVDSTRLVLTAPRGETVAASAVLESWVTAGTELIALEASIAGTGETLEGVLAATVAELNVGDLLALIQQQTGRQDLGSQIPPDVASLTNVRFELRSGDPPTFTVSATASALGQSTDFMYTMVPPDLPGLDLGGGSGAGTDTESGGGLFAIRLADWSLGNLLPSIQGTPFGDLSFPQVSFVMPSWDWGSSTPADPTTDDPSGGGTWSIPWGSLGPLARDFMMPSWPCVSCALPSGGTGEGGVGLPSLPDLGSFTLAGGLNFSAPISLADLSSAFSGLFDGLGGGGSAESGESVFFQGMPGISLAGLLSGNLDLTSLLDISADIDLSGLSALEDMPEWLTLGTTSFAVTNDPAVAVMLEVEASADIAETTLDFVLRADLSTVSADAPLVLTGRALTPWEQPFGIEWLTVDSTRLVLTAPRAEGDVTTVAASAVLETWVTAGSELIVLEASIEGTGETLEGVLAATIAELNVGDLLALIQQQTGRSDLGAQIPPDVASLTDVRFELRSGDPPTFTVSATASALGQSTEFMYTMVPPDLPGLDLGGGAGGGGGTETESGGGIFAIRLPDWSLSSLLPSIGGTPFGDLSFPQVSFVMPTWDWGGSTPAEPTPTDSTSGGTWSIPWGSFGPLARDFLMPSWPCVTCALPSGGTGEGGIGIPDLGSLSLSGGLNFSAPISLADLSAAFGGLFDGFGGGGGGGGDVVLQGMPGISLAGLLSGNFDLTSLLDIRGVLPPITEVPFGWPDWIRPTGQSLRITSQPTVRIEASVILEADLDGVKVFDLSAQATNAGGAGAELEGLMRGRWEQPFGLEWLAFDSVHVALAAGSVGPRVALGAGLPIGAGTAAVDMEVRGTSEDRSVDFRALARNLSTADVATFLNDAFDAGLAVPTNPITLDSLTIAFSSGDATSFDIVGGFSAGMDAGDALAALADLLPGASTATEPPFSLGTLAGAWFELHVVPDSVWGGYGGGVQLGEGGGPAFGGQAEIRLGASRTGAGDDWIVLDVQLAASDLSAADAVAALDDALPSGWEIPEVFAAASGVTLETASMRVGLDTRADSSSVELTGSGRYVDTGASFAASALLRMFAVGDTTWADGALSVALSDVSVTDGLEQAASLLGGDWALPESLSALAPIQLDTAALTVGFDSRADSLSARVSGAGTMGGAAGGMLSVLTDVSIVQLPTLTWSVGLLDVDVRDVPLPSALDQVANILPGDWSLPPSVSGLSPIVLDSAAMRLAFDTRDATYGASMTGGSHMGEAASRLEGTTDLRISSTADGQAVAGRVTLDVANLELTGLLAQAAELLPGEWSLPEGFDGFDALALDSAMLDVAFDTEADSLGASVRGLGRLADGDGEVDATASLELALVGDVSGARGAVELVATDLSTTEALDRIAALLPGDWQLPDGLDAFDAIALDSAGFVLGFDTWADSVFAGVAGRGTWDGLTADARLDFASLPAGSRAAGLITMSLGPVDASEAIETVADLLPGEWELPDGFSSFDALQLDGAVLTAGFDTRGDSTFASFQGSGRLEQRTATGRIGFTSVGDASYGSGLLEMTLGDVTLDDAFAEVANMLPGDWPTPDVDFELGTLRDVTLEVGFDTRADSLWAGVEAGATMAQRDGVATLAVVSARELSWVEGSFTVDVGDVTLTDALDFAASLVPSAPAVPQLGFDLGGLSDAVLRAGFRAGAADSAWAGISGRFDFGGLTGDAELGLALGADQPSGSLTARFDDSFGVQDVLSLLTGFMPSVGGIELPPLGPLDISLDDPLLTFDFGERSGISLGGTSSLFGKDASALFSMARIGGRPQLLLGVQVPDLSFTDLLPDFSTPLTDGLSLDLAALTLTRGEGRVEDEDLSPAERSFFQPLAGGLSDFSFDFRPGLNLTGLLPLSSGAMKDMVDMLSPGASNLTLQGTLPLPGFGGLRDLSLSAALPPMAPPGKPAWFVEGEIAVQITGRPSVGVAGALTIDVEGDTLTFDIESNVAIVPAGVELSIAGGLTAANPWVGPLGIEWLTLNELRLALGLSPIAVRLGFLADAAIAEKNLRVALGTKINIYTGVPIGVIVLAEAPEGMSLSELVAFQRQVAGPNAPALPADALPDMAVRDLGVKVATYTDLDLDVRAGIGLSGALFLSTGPGGSLEEFGSLDLSIDAQGILASGNLSAFSVGPVSFDDAMIDLALTLEEQHLVLSGGATIADLLSADIALAMTRDSLRFETDYELFDVFRTYMLVRAGFDLTNPTFQIHAALYPEFSDEVMLDVIDAVLPVGQASLTVANGALTVATNGLNGAQQALDDAIWAAGEASRIAMDAAYATYQLAVREYNRASSNYSYYNSRCTWYRPGDCAAAGYWASARTYWSGQKAISYPIYVAARSAYLNQDWLSSSAPVQAAYDAIATARATFNAARAEVERMQTALSQMQAYVDTLQSCTTCARPPMPFNVISAEFDAALDGFFGQSGVQLDVLYHIQGQRSRFTAGFSGSISDLAVNLVTAVTDAIF